jgi:hypothetical protein
MEGWPAVAPVVLKLVTPVMPVSPVCCAWKVFWPPVMTPFAPTVPPTLPVTCGLVCCV